MIETRGWTSVIDTATADCDSGHPARTAAIGNINRCVTSIIDPMKTMRLCEAVAFYYDEDALLPSLFIRSTELVDAAACCYI